MVGDHIPARSHHQVTGVAYHQLMGDAVGGARLGASFDERHGEKAV